MASPMAGRDLYLEVFVNGEATNLIGAFRERSDGTFASAPDELKELGIAPEGGHIGDDGLVSLESIPGISIEYDELAQVIRFVALDSSRAPKILNAAPEEEVDGVPAVATAGWGSVFNYTVVAGAKHDPLASHSGFDGISGAFDARVFSPYGVASNSFIARMAPSADHEITRLDTVWTYSDPGRMLTYRAGDFVTGGLAWTRPVRLGGIQIERNFGLRPDLVTVPLPSFSGSAAVPSLLEVYVGDFKVYSEEVGSGPFAVTGVPIATGAGTATIVVRDVLGQERRQDVRYFLSPHLLRPQLLDFSAEVGYPRRYYGTHSFDYDRSLFGSFSLRYGVTEWLTAEAHFEGGEEILNGGVGGAFALGSWGAGSLAGSVSRSGSSVGSQLRASVELMAWGVSFYGRAQRTFGDYQDIASVTADSPMVENGAFDPRPAKETYQLGLNIPLRFDPSVIGASYTSLTEANGEHRKLASLSFARPLPGNAYLRATAFANLGDNEEYGFHVGLSVPIGGGVTASTGAASGSDGYSGYTEIGKGGSPDPGSVGWRLRGSKAQNTDISASVNYSSNYGRLEGSVRKEGEKLSASASAEGAIVVAGGGVFVGNRIEDAFAIVDAGVPGIKVSYENRPVGTTGRQGRLLVPQLRSLETNRITIDPSNLPIDAQIATTSQEVVPAQRTGVIVDFGIKMSTAALVSFRDENGDPLPLSSLSQKIEGGETVVIGYDGEAYLQDLAPNNRVIVTKPDGSQCEASFAYQHRPGEQVRIGNVTCTPLEQSP